MLSISSRKQRKRPPFFKLCLADGAAGGRAGGQGQTSQTKICKMLSISIEKQRKCPPFLKLGLAEGWAGAGGGRGGQTSQRKYFQLICKSKGKAAHFGNNAK